MIQNEIIIVGGGPAGLTAALFLAKKGIASTILEKNSYPRDKICGDALSGKVAWVLNKLDPNLYNDFISDSGSMPSWGVKFFGTKNNELKVPFKLDYNALTDKAPGFIVERLKFDNKLYHLAKNNHLIKIEQETSVTSVERDSDSIILTLKNQSEHIESKMVLAADGAYSAIAKQLMNVQIPDNRNSLGLRAYYKGVTELDKEGFIELHFLKDLVPGYFWIFPLPNGKANVGLGMRADIIKKRKVNLKKVLSEIIHSHPVISKRFKNAECISPPKLHGLPLGAAKTMSSDNLILLGDAASLIDPFTGEGIGHAMISGMTAAEVIANNYQSKNYNAQNLSAYDKIINRRLKSEFLISQKMQELSMYPFLFNLVINKAIKNKELRETISCMFENVDMRSKFKDPKFYFNILFK